MNETRQVEPRRLKGFRDYLPQLMGERQRIMAHIRKHAGLAGFQEIATPALEYAETLVGQASDETDKQVYRFRDHGDRDVALRFDLTVPFARFVAEHQGELAFPFKRLQIGDVWRGENTQKGRFREFCQCDLDIIGVDSAPADIDVLLTFLTILHGVNVGPFTMALGHRPILSALVKRFIPGASGAHEGEALIAIDKLAKIGAEKVAALLAALPGAEGSAARELLHLITPPNAAADTNLAPIRQALVDDAAATAALDRFESTVKTLRGASAELTLGKARMDLTIARGLGYYTGIVFETTLDELPGFGSISSGGRYDGLVSRFSSRALAGVGGSIGLDRLLAGLEELKRLPDRSHVDVMIAIATPDARLYGISLAQRLREAGHSCDMGLTEGKVGAQFKHADRLRVKAVVTVGTDEMRTQTFALKNMRSGTEQKGVAAQDLIQAVSQFL